MIKSRSTAALLGPDHPSILTTRHGIAVALAGQGKAAEAETQFRELLADQLQTMGPDHPYTLTIRYDMAATMADQGKTNAAETQLGEILVNRIRILGPGHPDTVSTRERLERLRRKGR